MMAERERKRDFSHLERERDFSRLTTLDKIGGLTGGELEYKCPAFTYVGMSKLIYTQRGMSSAMSLAAKLRNVKHPCSCPCTMIKFERDANIFLILKKRAFYWRGWCSV